MTTITSYDISISRDGIYDHTQGETSVSGNVRDCGDGSIEVDGKTLSWTLTDRK